MNELVELLDELQKKAKADPILREKLLQTNVAPMAAEKIPRRLKGKMTSMSCFWQR